MVELITETVGGDTYQYSPNQITSKYTPSDIAPTPERRNNKIQSLSSVENSIFLK
jgi:hypothetical protein